MNQVTFLPLQTCSLQNIPHNCFVSFSDLFFIILNMSILSNFILKNIKTHGQRNTGTSKARWHSMALIFPGCEKKAKSLYDTAASSVRMQCLRTCTRGSSTCPGPTSLLYRLLVPLQLGKQRWAADLLEAPMVEGGSQLQKDWNPLLLTALGFPADQERERWRNLGVPWDCCQPTLLRPITSTLSAPGLPSAKLDSGCSLLFHGISCSTADKATMVQEQAAPPAQPELSTCTLGGDRHFI